MYKINNLFNNDDIRVVDTKGAFTVIEYLRDLSVMPGNAQLAYFCNEMNVRKRQVICEVGLSPITTQAGAMQWTVGNVKANTGIKGMGDLFGKALRGSVTGESAIKPEYAGTGTLVLEPTYKHLILIDLADWNGSIVLDGALTLGVSDSATHITVADLTGDNAGDIISGLKSDVSGGALSIVMSLASTVPEIGALLGQLMGSADAPAA